MRDTVKLFFLQKSDLKKTIMRIEKHGSVGTPAESLLLTQNAETIMLPINAERSAAFQPAKATGSSGA